MKFIISIILIASSILAFGQETKTKNCSPTIEALESRGDIKIINNCGLDEKQLKQEFEKFRDAQRTGQRDIQYSLKKIAQLFNDYKKLNFEKLDTIQQTIQDGNLKLDKLIDSQNSVKQRNIEIDKNTLQEVVYRQYQSDLELILTTIPSLTMFSSGDITSRLISESDIYLSCPDLVKVLAELAKLGGLSFYGGNFIYSISDRITRPFHLTCYNEVGSYVSIFDRPNIIRELHSRKIKLDKAKSGFAE